jgi:hypothetical protein
MSVMTWRTLALAGSTSGNTKRNAVASAATSSVATTSTLLRRSKSHKTNKKIKNGKID